MDRVFTPTNSSEQIYRALGKPTRTVVYTEPVLASAIPRLASHLQFHEELPSGTPIGRCDDFAFRGRIYNPDGEGLAYLNTFLPIMGEIIAFPFAAYQAIKESRQIHRYRVWYRADERYFAHVELSDHREEK